MNVIGLNYNLIRYNVDMVNHNNDHFHVKEYYRSIIQKHRHDLKDIYEWFHELTFLQRFNIGIVETVYGDNSSHSTWNYIDMMLHGKTRILTKCIKRHNSSIIEYYCDFNDIATPEPVLGDTLDE